MVNFAIRIFLIVAAMEIPEACMTQQSAANPVQDVTIASSKDSGARIPLLVFLHSWSTDYKTAGGWDEVLDETRRRGWAVIVQNFRGPNNTPEACASDLAVQDVLDSVDFARKRAPIDSEHDGHEGNAVPLHQSLEAFNVLAKANGAPGKILAEEDIAAMTKEARIPNHLAKEIEDEPACKEKILFRRMAGPVTLTIFDGGHSVDIRTGIRYFE